MEEVGVYSFSVDDLALRSCQGANGHGGVPDGATCSKPSLTDLARSRVNEPVQISGSRKRAMLTPHGGAQGGDWEASSKALADTLMMANWVMIEDGMNWKVIQAPDV